jgi:hypothetical protein
MIMCAARWAALSSLLALGGCGSQVHVDLGSCARLEERVTMSTIDRIDLLLVIDDSMGMADQQRVLARSLPAMLRQLAGDDERHVAFDDLHVGVVSSSLGGRGSDACAGPHQNEQAQLLARSAPGGEPLATYQQRGFVVYDGDPTWPTHDPPGESSIDALTAKVQQMVLGVGQQGCGYEAPLEAWYRFLVEPEPYREIRLEDGHAVGYQVDDELLEQRRRFLRPDSLLAIVMLSNENDCSVRADAQSYLTMQQYSPTTGEPYRMLGCDAGADDCSSGPLAPIDDSVNLRCFDQKRRFGIDLLYPTDRYVTGLSSPTVMTGAGVKPNPIFSDLDPADDNHNVRDPGLVFLGAIVGVPWQDIARRDAAGQPDLAAGFDANGQPHGGYQSGAELAVNGTWELLLEGGDPLMRESIEPRGGKHPLTGDAIELAVDHPIHGGERDIPQRDDLQFACITPLVDDNGAPSSRDCSDPSAPGCDCGADQSGNPLCDPSDPTRQWATKAYPGLRQLAVVRELGDQGMVGSVCPAQQHDPSRADFGYSQSLSALGERLKISVSGQCLSRVLDSDARGRVDCLMLEARRSGNCSCDLPGRRPVASEHRRAVELAMDDPLYELAKWDCFCELEQLEGAALQQCQQSNADEPQLDGEPIAGWCYVDASTFPPVGNPDIVASCPSRERRNLRLLGHRLPAPGSTTFIYCANCRE